MKEVATLIFGQELQSLYGPKAAFGAVCDVRNLEEVERMVAGTVAALGPLTVMIANAGITQVKPIFEITKEEITRMFDINFVGVWNCYTSAAKQMISQGPVASGSQGYRILGAASMVAFKSYSLAAHYSASKWAVRGLTQSMAMEMAKYQINVNAYAPGVVGTAMWDTIDKALGHIEGKTHSEDAATRYSKEATALGRVGRPEDVAKVVGGFLCSKDSDFVTGQTILVDGGIIFT